MILHGKEKQKVPESLQLPKWQAERSSYKVRQSYERNFHKKVRHLPKFKTVNCDFIDKPPTLKEKEADTI